MRDVFEQFMEAPEGFDFGARTAIGPGQARQGRISAYISVVWTLNSVNLFNSNDYDADTSFIKPAD
jgi:hypothetical protein